MEVNGYTIEPGANLTAAYWAVNASAKFNRAIANEDTIWPDGFDPMGVIFED